MARRWRKQTSLKWLTLPLRVKNRQFYARKKTKAPWVGPEPSVLWKHKKPAFGASLRKYHSQNPSRCEKMCRLPSQTWQALCTVSLPQKKEIREEVGVQILLSIVKNLLSQKRGTTTAMFRKAEATPSKWCSIQMKFHLDRINVWHDSVCCRGFLSLPWILIKKEIWGFIFSDPKVPEFIN